MKTAHRQADRQKIVVIGKTVVLGNPRAVIRFLDGFSQNTAVAIEIGRGIRLTGLGHYVVNLAGFTGRGTNLHLISLPVTIDFIPAYRVPADTYKALPGTVGILPERGGGHINGSLHGIAVGGIHHFYQVGRTVVQTGQGLGSRCAACRHGSLRDPILEHLIDVTGCSAGPAHRSLRPRHIGERERTAGRSV